jgi:Domain of Unknown Function (DUF928)
MRFVLRRADNNKAIYQTTLPNTGSQGIVSFTLPASADAPSLETGNTYKWSFTLVCDPEDPSGNKIASGTIGRVAPPAGITSELEQATQRDKVAVYAKYGIWYDAISAIAQLRHTSDSDALKQDWATLLQSVALQKITNERLLQPLTTSNPPTSPSPASSPR